MATPSPQIEIQSIATERATGPCHLLAPAELNSRETAIALLSREGVGGVIFVGGAIHSECTGERTRGRERGGPSLKRIRPTCYDASSVEVCGQIPTVPVRRCGTSSRYRRCNMHAIRGSIIKGALCRRVCVYAGRERVSERTSVSSRERERDKNEKKREREKEKRVGGGWRALSVCATLKKKEEEKSGPARGMLTML